MKKTVFVAIFSTLAISAFSFADGKRAVASAPAQPSVVCGLLNGECLNGGHCSHFLTQFNGHGNSEINILGKNASVAGEFSNWVEKSVKLTGRYTRNGFVADSIEAADSTCPLM